MTPAEIVAAIAALPADAHDDLVTALQQDDSPPVKKFRSTAFAAGKKEGARTLKALETERDEAKAAAEEAQAALEQLKGTTPDKDAIEAPWKAKVEKLTKERGESEGHFQGRIKALLQQRDTAAFEKLLAGQVGEDERKKYGIEFTLDPEYAAMKARDLLASGRFRYTDKDELEVLDEDGVPFPVLAGQPPYTKLAAQLNKSAADKWKLSAADGGAGVRGGGGGTLTAQTHEERVQAARRNPMYGGL